MFTRAELLEILEPIEPQTVEDRLAGAVVVCDTGVTVHVVYLHKTWVVSDADRKREVLQAAYRAGLAVVEVGSGDLFKAQCNPLGFSIDMVLAKATRVYSK